VAKRHAKVLPMSSDLDDLLRRDDDDGETAGAPANQQPLPQQVAPARNLTDALNMIASLPEGGGDQVPAGDLDDIGQGELLEAEKELSHGP